MRTNGVKPIHWIGPTRKELKQFPDDVRHEIGFALYAAQRGLKSDSAVPMLGFNGAKVLEVVICDDGNAYRAIYTVKFAEFVYVLHVFQKKSKRGVATPRPDMDLINIRLRSAERHYEETYRRMGSKEKANARP